MEAKIYGVMNHENVHIDVSKTERGAKRYATLNGYDTISYRFGYHAFQCAKKVNGKWINYSIHF